MNTFSPNGSLVSLETWLAAIASSACIGFTSLVPWLFNLTFFEQRKASEQQDGQDGGDSQMKYLLSFAIGAILGDIFFHLIPESIESHLTELGNSTQVAERNVGISIIAGIFLFIIVEMVLQKWSGQDADTDSEDERLLHSNNCDATVPVGEIDGQDLKQNAQLSGTRKMFPKPLLNENNNNNVTTDSNGNIFDSEPATYISDRLNNNHLFDTHDQILISRKRKDSNMTKDDPAHSDKAPLNKMTIEQTDKAIKMNKNLSIDPAGYLNLIANGFDNFTHGLAIGASFLVGMKVGVLTTFVIFIHEIPHEICDYAILIKSGFSRWEAVKAQSSVSLFGIMGTALALYVKSVDKLNAKTVWILPFSAGGFLYIALVTLLPDILDKESNLRNSLGQIASVILGIAFMGMVALL